LNTMPAKFNLSICEVYVFMNLCMYILRIRAFNCLLSSEDADHMSNKYLDDGGRLSSRVAREMLKDIFGTKEVNQCINDTLGLNL
jgi:hypothetical protein